jgi:hypothetical protein
MVSITITPAAYEAIRSTFLDLADALPAGLDGLIRIWLDRRFVDRLGQMRGPGESYSDGILQLVGGQAGEQSGGGPRLSIWSRCLQQSPSASNCPAVPPVPRGFFW